ncbi:hypothetical protein [Anaerosinus massiliensis]|uniref:hypothetical protein n=1 Tax=Massilibacillus massiliensis TaxID=1806837 RepID=UPI0018FE7119|nr:hypothetical protein [Massilibacillus massiliensis]
MKRICSIVAIIFWGSIVYSLFWLFGIASDNNISKEEYARMAQELVEQSLKPIPSDVE